MFYRIEHEKLHAKHKGHEAMHMEMVLILFSTLIVAQVLLVKWKKHYYKSFMVNNCFYFCIISTCECNLNCCGQVSSGQHVYSPSL